jgi:LysR family transcriptional regulator, glycine cleavage system transcriptional activator
MPNWTAPSISSVRAFEASARLSSFTRAAEELNITQSAISHAIRELEARLGVALFRREGRVLELTEAGRLYLPFVADALARLRAGDQALRDPVRRARVLTVSVSPSFAAKWLAPRLGSFSSANPDLDLRISATPQHIDFMQGEIDVAVRHGDGNWPHLSCTRLCEETMFPVCSPALMRGRKPRTPADLPNLTLIHHRNADAWRAWLGAFDVSAPARAFHGPTFSEMNLAIDAAIAGQGIALARSALAERDLREGRLARPLTQERTAPFSYWIVCPKMSAETPKIARFREWLLAEAAPAAPAKRARRSQ